MKNKIKRRNKAFKSWYVILILIVIIILMSTSYSLWQTELKVQGTITSKYEPPDLPIQIPSQGKDDNGIDRVTVNTDMKFALTTIFEVTDEVYENNKITTTISHVYHQVLGSTSPSMKITFSIPNSANKTFTNGTISLTDYNDSNSTLENLDYTVSPTTIEPGDSSTVTITGKVRGNRDVADNTFYNFTITFNIDGVKHYFYYSIIFLENS